MKNKKKYSFIILMFFIIIIIGVLFVTFNKQKEYKELYSLEGYKTGDVKFYKDNKIITGKDGYLHIINLETKEDKMIDVKVNWLDTIPNENIIIYGNFDNEVGFLRLDNHDRVITNNVVIKSNDLRIDPSITKVDSEYYFTTTKIEGAVNNKDPKKENGEYTIELYKTKDLKTITKVADVMKKRNNLEDVEIHYADGALNIVYEKETYDTGPSDITLIRSLDKGKSWSKEKILIKGPADNEPATLIKDEDSYLLFYSSDEEDIGKSYAGAKSYSVKLDENFNFIHKYSVPLRISKNMILYDIREYHGKYEALYVNDYLGKGNLYVDQIKNIGK